MLGRSSGVRFTLAVSADKDGTMLTLFSIIKRILGESIDLQLLSMFPHGIVGCAQAKASMDGRTMEVRYKTS